MARWLCVAILAAYPYRAGCECGSPIVPVQPPPIDAGSDAGVPDAGTTDSGTADSGLLDAGADAGRSDGGTLFHVYFASQTVTQSLLVQLRYDLSDDSVMLVDTFDLTPTVGADRVRVLLDRDDPVEGEGLLVAGFSTPSQFYRVLLNPMRVSGAPLLLSGRPVAELSDITGGCILPNKNIVASSYGNGLVSEFSPTGAYVRELTNLFSFYMTDCASTGVDMITIDNDANSDGFGFVRHLFLDGGNWVQTAQRALHTTDGGAEGAAYVAVLHNDGTLYLPPLSPGSNSQNRMLRCPGADLAICNPVGARWPVDYPVGAVTGAVQIPGHPDLLVIDNRSLYRFRVNTDTLVPLYMPNIPTQQWVRMMRIRPL